MRKSLPRWANQAPFGRRDQPAGITISRYSSHATGSCAAMGGSAAMPTGWSGKGPVAERGRELRLVAKHGGEGPDRLQTARSQDAERLAINADARTAGPGKPTHPLSDHITYIH